MAHYTPLIAAFFSALCLFAAPAQAAKRIQLSHFPPNPGVGPGGGWKFTPGNKWADPPPQRAWIDGVYGDVRRVGAEDVIKLAGKAGELAVTARSLVTVSEAAAVVARCLGNPACIAAAGVGAAVMAELYREYRIRPVPGSDGLEFDPGDPEAERTVFNCTIGTQSASGATRMKACQDALEKARIKEPGNYPTMQTWGSPPNQCVRSWSYSITEFTAGRFRVLVHSIDSPGGCSGPTGIANGEEAGISEVKEKYCKQVDFSDPAFSFPAVGKDGKCPSGRYQPITADAATQKIAADPPPSIRDILRDALKEALEGGQKVEADFETSGPAKQIGSPSSTTTTNGQGTTTTTTTPEYHYKYDGDTITYETVNITQTCVGANSCSNENATETKTETKPPPKEGDEKDPCSIAPDRAGCAKLGTPGEGEDIKKKDIPVSITPDGGWGADTGSCPGPITLANGLTVDPFGLFCKYMAGIRFAVIGVAWLIAAFIFLGRIE